MRLFLSVALGLALASPMLAQTVCQGEDYAAGLCHFRKGEFSRAEEIFSKIAADDVKEPSTIRSRYFLARVMMKTKRCEEASRQLVSIYVLSPAFYNEWSCDYLLGECRKRLGQD